MKTSLRAFAQPLSMLACLGLSAGGCILVADDAETLGGGGDETGWVDDDDATTGATSGDGQNTDAAETTGGTTGGDTDGEPVDAGLVCEANIMLDPGFEAGTPNPSWEERSELFGTPLCDESCSSDESAQPYEGQWWAWFGGYAEPETASVSQEFTVDSERALVSFMLAMSGDEATGGDILTVSVDDQEVHMISDAEMDDYVEWTEVIVDISQFADGQPHVLEIEASLTGETVTNFFVDDVWVQGCVAEGASESDTDGTSSDTDTDTDAGTDTDGGAETGDSSDTDSATTSGTDGGTSE